MVSARMIADPLISSKNFIVNTSTTIIQRPGCRMQSNGGAKMAQMWRFFPLFL
jgi:hypothetical protein